MSVRAALVTIALLCAACGQSSPSEPGPAAPALFPENYATSYEEVRGCRKSGDHDLEFVRVLADPSALGAYLDRSAPFPEGAVVLKEQYDFSDTTCEGAIVQWTVMAKHAGATDRLGWDWQRVGADRRVLEQDAPRCVGCHTGCTGGPSVGYDYTCADP